MAMRQRAMSVSAVYGRPRISVMKMTHGFFKRKRRHLVQITAGGELKIHQGVDDGSGLLIAAPLKQILSVGRMFEDENSKRTELVICLPQGPVTLIASDLNEMRLWITALNPPLKPTTQGAAANIAAAGDAPIVSGWLGLDGRKESWCLLRKGSIVHYKQREDQDPAGAIPLDILCTVKPPTAASALASAAASARRMTTGSAGSQFVLNVMNKQWIMHTRTLADANRWVAAIQDVIECSPPLTTKFEKCINLCQDIDSFALQEILLDKALLCYSDEQLEMPLSPLPYGVIGKSSSGNEFTYPHVEALRLFESTLPDGKSRYGSLHEDPGTYIRNLLQVFLEVPCLRNEIFCQAVKQVSKHPKPDSSEATLHWHVLCAVCVHFTPTGKLLKYMRAILRLPFSTKDTPANIKQMANYCLAHLETHHIARAFDPTVIDAILSGRAYAAQSSTILAPDSTLRPDGTPRKGAHQDLDEEPEVLAHKPVSPPNSPAASDNSKLPSAAKQPTSAEETRNPFVPEADC